MSTITTIAGSDKIKDSRAVINTNFENLNTDKVEKDNVLEKDNTTVFVPTADYHPATKKYVDDTIPSIPVTSVAGKTGAVLLVKADVGLGNVDNTSDVNKPISTATQAALDGKQASMGSDDNYVTDAEKVIIGNTSGSNTGDQDLSALALKSNVLEKNNTTSFTPDADYEPATKKYVDDNIPNVPVSSVAGKTGVVTLVKADVGLGNVDNTTDAGKPISSATQSALDGKQASMGSDDNYVTDAEKIVIGNTSGTNTGDQEIPVKATGTELDTGTDDTKFATAKALVDSKYMKNDESVTLTNKVIDGDNNTIQNVPAAAIKAGSLVAEMVASDHGAAGTDQLVNVCYGTSATPPTANTTTIGTLYIQYTA